MIPTPLFPDSFLILSYLSTLLLSIAIFGYAKEKYGSKAYGLFGFTFIFGVAVEHLGETTGFPFGQYRYTVSGPSILGVPLIVPLGWWAFTMIALSVPSKYKYWLAPLALVAWDAGLDPLMVKQGFWVFSQGVYYGVPISNFFGWFIAGCVLVRLLIWLEPRLLQDSSPVLRFTFGVQAFLMGVGLTVFYAMPLAGVITFLSMGLCLLMTREKS
jgi:putative membrane protein